MLFVVKKACCTLIINKVAILFANFVPNGYFCHPVTKYSTNYSKARVFACKRKYIQ
jgi:hypothetical protein